MKNKFLVMLGTAREGRESEKVTNFVQKELEKMGEDFEFFDVRDHLSGMTVVSSDDGDNISEWVSAVRRSDAIIIVCPEYNHSYPGEFKIAFDSAEDTDYDRRPVLFITVSSGVFAGVRVFERLIPLAVIASLVPLPKGLHIGSVEKTFLSGGELTDDKVVERFRGLVEMLDEYATALKSIRKS